MIYMAVWMHSVFVPVGIALVTTVLVNLTVGPRLAARSKRIQAVHDSRDRFGDYVLDILAVCTNLQTVVDSRSVGGEVASQLQQERKRWEDEIDEATAWLADHWQRFALSYLGSLDLRELIVKYVGGARGVWLSNRSLDERVRMVKEMTEPIQTIFFTRRWRVVSSIPKEADRLRSMLASLEGNDQTPATPDDASGGALRLRDD